MRIAKVIGKNDTPDPFSPPLSFIVDREKSCLRGLGRMHSDSLVDCAVVLCCFELEDEDEDEMDDEEEDEEEEDGDDGLVIRLVAYPTLNISQVR